MYFIGWDIGIKNLAYCIIEKTKETEKIIDLNIINLIDDIIIPKCNQINKNDNPCKSTSLYKLDNLGKIDFYCNKHSKELDK